MKRLNSDQRKSGDWIAGSARDWLIPYRCNSVFQLAHVCLAALAIMTFLFWDTRSTQELLELKLTGIAAVAFLASAEFGRGTVKAYRRSRKMFERKGRLQAQVQLTYAKKSYCVRAGVRTAAADCGLVHELTPALAKRWKLF